MKPVLLEVAHSRQTEDGQCVPVCVLMALTYQGVMTSYEQIAGLMDTRWFGTASSKVREVEKLGVSVVYKQGTLDEIYQHLSGNRPCIAFVKTGNLPYWTIDIDHAVLVIGLDDRLVYLNDPELDRGAIPIPRDDFDLAWLERDEMYATFFRAE